MDVEGPEETGTANAEALARFETAPHGVILVRDDGRVGALDDAAALTLGWARQDAVGRPLADLLPGAAWLEAPSPGGRPTLLRVLGRRADGAPVLLEVVVARGGTGADAWVVAVRPIGAGADPQARRMDEMALLGRFAAKAAHDLKNFLMAIGGYTELALPRLETDPERARRMLGEVLDSVAKMRDYLEAIHALGSGKPDGVRPIDPAAQIRGLEADLAARLSALETARLEAREKAQRSGIALVPAVPAPPRYRLVTDTRTAEGACEAQPRELDQLLLALVENAWEALETEGTITLSAGTRTIRLSEARVDLLPGRYVTFSVADTGRGLTPDQEAHLFEPFLRRGRDRGRGLALATLHAVARRHHGAVEVQTAPGRGTTITLLLPRLDPAALRPGEGVLGREIGNGHREPQGTVLVVDDVAQVREIVRDVLEDAGYRVVLAGGGQEALRLLNSPDDAVDLLLTDVLMPEMNGAELAEAVGREHPELPVLFMSAYARDVLPRGRDGRAVPFIAKPFSPSDLVAKVKAVLKGAA